MRKNPTKRIKLEVVDSTNSYISRKLSDSDIPLCVTASFQSAGRGQGENKWNSEKDKNLLASYVFSPEDLKAAESFFVSRISSLAVAEFYSEYLKAVEIKWPNDILCENKKLAGILIENRFYGDRIDKSIIGMGININQEEFPVFSPEAASIKSLTGKTIDIEEALDNIMEKLEYWVKVLNDQNYTLIVKEYNRRLFRLMEDAIYKAEDELFEARLSGVEDDGHLILLTPSGETHKFAFKEVEFIFS